MVKKIFFIVVLFALAFTAPVSAAWTERISGGSSYSSNYGEFTVTLSAWQNSDGSFGGQGQYYYPPLERTFHLEVTKVCTGIVPSGEYAGQSYAVAVGPIKGQDDTEVNIGFGGIAVVEGDEAGDAFRVAFDETSEYVINWCENGAEAHFPAKVLDGNFNIRTK